MGVRVRYGSDSVRASNLESEFYKDIDKLGPSYKKEIERMDFDVSLKMVEVGQAKEESRKECLEPYTRGCLLLTLSLKGHTLVTTKRQSHEQKEGLEPSNSALLILEPFVLFHSQAISFISVGLFHPLEQVREPRVNELKEPHDRIVHRLCIWMCIKKGWGRGRERKEAAAAPHELLTRAVL
nr:hypothetical protein [Tanacetum cinerariifolium]